MQNIKSTERKLNKPPSEKLTASTQFYDQYWLLHKYLANGCNSIEIKLHFERETSTRFKIFETRKLL